MCGIAGFTHFHRSPDRDRIHRAVTSLIHRGPDQRGVYESSHVSLGATRLKVIDLDSGDQPVISANRDVVLAFNGEIYNHAELRRELETLGHRFRGVSDTEVVLEAFVEWDIECLTRLRGMFALALWTESTRRLVLARDRIGIKPLYVTRHQGDLFFGSELKAILVHPEIERRLSQHGLDCYLSLNYVPCPWTLIEGIEKLPPGSWLEWREGQFRSGFYWTLPRSRPQRWDAMAAQEQLDSLLKSAVREQLVADVPLGLWLSGGVDSSTVLHYAAEASARPINTFSISFAGRSFDETSQIRRIAGVYGSTHQELDVNEDSGLSDAIEEFAYYSDEPDADAGALPVWFLSRLTRGKATVALSGEGADELFGGYLTYRANRLARPMRRIPSTALGLALEAVRYWPVSDEKISFEYKVKRFLEGCRMSPERAHVFWNGTFSDAEKAQLLQKPLPGALARILKDMNLSPRDSADDLWFDQKYFLPDDILTKVDRMSMAHAVEVRPPFLDERIVEFAATLPLSLKIDGSRQKIILKNLMAGKLPASVLTRPKIGFDIPAHEWLRGSLRPLLLDSLAAGCAAYPDLFRPGVVETYVRSHAERSANVGYHLWGLMILFLWMRKWNIQLASVPAVRHQLRGTA